MLYIKIMYLRAILCTFQISVEKVSVFRASPPKMPRVMDSPPQNHFVPPHINNRYINS